METIPPEQPENHSASRDEELKWLLQYYSDSKIYDHVDSESSDPSPGFAVLPAEKYRIGDELGSGGMKSVLRTLDQNTDRHVAMALIRQTCIRRTTFSRFVREARITAALEHPNIVPVYDIGIDAEGRPYFTMKLIGGETLHSILQKISSGSGAYPEHYPLSNLLQVFQGVCHAVSFAHSRGVIHMDLKPANIQVGNFGEVLVLDWGLAKVLDRDPILYPNRLILSKNIRDVHTEGLVSGTPGFMSPEQERGEYVSLDEATDIYSLGAILSAILNFGGSKTMGHSRTETSKVPAALEAVVMKAMSAQPEHRYRSVEDLAGDVQSYMQGYATKAQQAGALTLLWLLFKRHSVVVTLAAVSFITVFTILTVSLVKIRHSEQVAIDALARIKAEQASKYKIGLLAAPHVMQDAQDHLRVLEYDQALSALERATALDKSLSDAWWDLASIRLGRQEFGEARHAFTNLPKPDPTPPGSPPLDMQGIVEKYSAIQRTKGLGGLQNAQGDFVYDIIHANHDAWAYQLIAAGAFFESHNRILQKTDFKLIEQALKWLNPGAEDLVFTHEDTPMGLKIGIHGDKVTEILPLVGLPISVLDASRTGAIYLAWLRDAPLLSLDLSQNATADLAPLSQNPTLQELRLVGWRNKDYNHLQPLLQLKRVIVDAADVPAAHAALAKNPSPPEIIGR